MIPFGYCCSCLLPAACVVKNTWKFVKIHSFSKGIKSNNTIISFKAKTTFILRLGRCCWVFISLICCFSGILHSFDDKQWTMLFQLKLLHSIPNGPKVLTCCRCMTKPSNCEHIAKQSHLQIGNQSKVEWWCNSNTCLCKLKVTFSNFGRCRIWRKHHFMNSRFFIFNIHNVNFNAKGVTYLLPFLFFWLSSIWREQHWQSGSLKYAVAWNVIKSIFFSLRV